MNAEPIAQSPSPQPQQALTVLLKELVATRRRAKLSLTGLARRMHSTPPTVCRLETGDHLPTFTTLARYAEALDMQLVIQMQPRP